MWGISFTGGKEDLTGRSAEAALVAAESQAANDEERDQIHALQVFIGDLAEQLPATAQVVISASGEIVPARGELRIVVSYSPAPAPALAEPAAVSADEDGA